MKRMLAIFGGVGFCVTHSLACSSVHAPSAKENSCEPAGPFPTAGCLPAIPYDGGLPDGALEGGPTEADAGGGDTSPQAPAPYPTTHLGERARKGNTPGDVMANIGFQGYPNGDRAQGLQKVALSDYYDPNSRRVIQLVAGTAWDTSSKLETQSLQDYWASHASGGATLIFVLVEGASHQPSTSADLLGWATNYGLTFTSALDPGATRLGHFFDTAAAPWNAYLDARTMEILQVGVGLPTSSGGTTDGSDDLVQWLAWVGTHPPAY